MLPMLLGPCIPLFSSSLQHAWEEEGGEQQLLKALSRSSPDGVSIRTWRVLGTRPCQAVPSRAACHPGEVQCPISVTVTLLFTQVSSPDVCREERDPTDPFLPFFVLFQR